MGSNPAAPTITAPFGETIHRRKIYQQNAMNNCLIMAGICIKPLLPLAKKVAVKVGKIKPFVADNSCNSQSATDYLARYA